MNTAARIRTRTPFLTSTSSYHRDLSSIDFGRRRFFWALSDFDDAVIFRADLDSLSETRKKRVAAMFDPLQEAPSSTFIQAVYTSPVTGDVYMAVGSGNSCPIFRFSGSGLDECARFGDESSATHNWSDIVTATVWMAEVETGIVSQTYDTTSELLFLAPTELLTQVMLGPFGMLSMFDSGETYPFGYILAGGLFGDLALFDYLSLRFIWCDELDPEFSLDTTIRGMTKGAKGEGWGDAWVVGTKFYSPYDALHFYRIWVKAGATFIQQGIDGSGVTLGVKAEKTAVVTAAELHPAATGISSVWSIWFDPADSGVLVAVALQGVASAERLCVLKYRQADGVVWKTFLGYALDAFGAHNVWQSRLINNTLAFVGIAGGAHTSVIKLGLATGEVLYEDEWPIQALELYGPQWYDSLHEAIYYYDHPTVRWARIYLDRFADTGTTLGTIVADVCERAGLAPADIDVTQLTDAVRGYLIARPSTARAAIEQLANAYFFDGVESDNKLVFRKRGMLPNFAIDESRLLVAESGALSEKRTQEVELPERVTIRYTDFARDYNASTQTVRRVTHPVPTMHTRNQTLIELPISAVADEAKRWAHTHLHRAYNERSQYEFSLPASYLALEPTDVVALTLVDGTLLTVRVISVDIGVDFSIKVGAVSQEMALYQSQITADTGLGGVSAPIAVSGATLALLPDLPLLRDEDATDVAHRQYLWAGGYSDGWPGGIVYRAPDAVSYAAVARVGRSQAMSYGYADVALPAPASPWATDNESVLDVTMIHGGDRLASITQDELVNGGNPAMLYDPGSGFAELIQYRDVEMLGDERYRLTGLLRGRRGTDLFCGYHRIGELFVLLDAATAQMATLPLGDRGAVRLYKVPPIGRSLETVTPIARRLRGFDLMPYAPVLVRAALAAGDVHLSWTRRTRLGGEW
ncbi:MAG: phage tail protein, partial [Rhodospirillales bacterium]